MKSHVYLTIQRRSRIRPLAPHLYCFLVVCVGLCIPAWGQIQLESPKVGDEELKGKMSANATGVEVELNRHLLAGASLAMSQATFTLRLPNPLQAGDTVRVREIANGAAGGWSDFCVVQGAGAKAAGSSPPKPANQACGAQLNFSPAQLSFPKQDPNQPEKGQPWGTASDPQSVTLTNNGDDTELSLEVQPKETQSFRIVDSACPSTLAAKAQCTFKVIYLPKGSFDGATSEARVINSMCEAKNAAVKDATDAVNEAAKDILTVVSSMSKGAETNERYQALQNKSGSHSGRQSGPKDLVPEQQSQYVSMLRSLDSQAHGLVVTGIPEHWRYPFTRAVAGIDISAPSSSTVKQAYFLEFTLLAPLGHRSPEDDALNSRVWGWLNPRITSLPQASKFGALSTINASGAFFDDLTSKGTVKDIAEGLDVSGGLEFVLLKPRQGLGWWSEYPNTKARMGISLITAAGISTPFSVDQTDVTSRVNQSICDAFNNSSTHSFTCNPATADSPRPTIQDGDVAKQFITFVTPERSRFFRRFYTGVRLKTFFFSNIVAGKCVSQHTVDSVDECETPYNIFPGIIDVTTGKDEAVTGGRLSRWLLRIEASYPLPWYQGLHIFGSLYTGFGGERSTTPFNAPNIQTPGDDLAATDANTFRFPVPPLNRDYFRVGVGVDLVQIFKKVAQPPSSSSK